MRLDASSDFFKKQPTVRSILFSGICDSKTEKITYYRLNSNQALLSENGWHNARKRGRKKASCNFAIK